MSHDAATIAAFVDGELDDVTLRRIAREAASDPALAAEIERYRALTARLTRHYAPILDEALPARLTAAIADSAGVDSSLAARRAAKARPRFAAMHWGAIAAALVLGLMIGTGPWTPAGPVASKGGIPVAAGGLEQALDTQLAAAQPAGADVRIGLSFRDRDGRYCRTFASPALGGISCRTDGAWRIEQTVGGTTASDYRQAGSGTIGAAAAKMMAGAPLDADAERAARAKNWVQ